MFFFLYLCQGEGRRNKLKRSQWWTFCIFTLPPFLLCSREPAPTRSSHSLSGLLIKTGNPVSQKRRQAQKGLFLLLDFCLPFKIIYNWDIWLFWTEQSYVWKIHKEKMLWTIYRRPYPQFRHRKVSVFKSLYVF